MKTSIAVSALTSPVHWLAFGLGSGLPTRAPGTFGTLAAVPLWWWLLADLPLSAQLAVVVVGFALGVWLCERTSRDLGVHDHPGIVWDEWIGLWISLLAVPANGYWLLAGFVLFRVFDILKPWPIGWLDRQVKGGFGIMIDDVLAGLMALACLHLAALVVSP